MNKTDEELLKSINASINANLKLISIIQKENAFLEEEKNKLILKDNPFIPFLDAIVGRAFYSSTPNNIVKNCYTYIYKGKITYDGGLLVYVHKIMEFDGEVQYSTLKKVFAPTEFYIKKIKNCSVFENINYFFGVIDKEITVEKFHRLWMEY